MVNRVELDVRRICMRLVIGTCDEARASVSGVAEMKVGSQRKGYRVCAA